MKKETRNKLLASAGRVTEGAMISAGSTAATGVGGPFAGIAAGSAIQAMFEVLREVWSSRSESRGAAMAEAAIKELANHGVADVREHAAANPDFSEVVFQSYRRCLDAIDPAVIPALARLMAMYSSRAPDAFFRGVGRILEDLSHDEMNGFGQIVSNALATNFDPVNIMGWIGEGNRRELRLAGEKGKSDKVFGMIRPTGAERLLKMLEIHGLTDKPILSGVDLAMEGRTCISRTTLSQLVEVLGDRESTLFPSDYKRFAQDDPLSEDSADSSGRHDPAEERK